MECTFTSTCTMLDVDVLHRFVVGGKLGVALIVEISVVNEGRALMEAWMEV